jgi:hypothetical protein
VVAAARQRVHGQQPQPRVRAKHLFKVGAPPAVPRRLCAAAGTASARADASARRPRRESAPLFSNSDISMVVLLVKTR